MSALLGDQCKHGCHKKTRKSKYWFRQKRYVVYKSWLLSVNLQFEFFLEKLS